MDKTTPTDISSLLISTPLWSVLDSLLQNPDLELMDSEIAAQISDVQKSAVNNSLRKLAETGITKRTPRGKMMLNQLLNTPLIKQLKIVSNLLQIDLLVKKLKPCCSKIVLFGSRAIGQHDSESDFDVFAISFDEDKARKTSNRLKISKKLQLIIRTPEQMLTFKKDEPALFEQLKEGIVLWQKE